MPTRRPGRPPAASFFIRLWLETNVETDQWRGQVRHVQSGETAYFVDVEVLLSFLVAHSSQAFLQTRGKTEFKRKGEDRP